MHTRLDLTLKSIKREAANICDDTSFKALVSMWNIFFKLLPDSDCFHKANFFPITSVFCCRWRKDNTEIDFSAEGSHYSLMGGNLVISNPVKEQHVGSYSCLAANTFGTVISREASVQFGCRWRRCEAPCRLQ